MKKFLSFILAVIIIASFCIIPASAAVGDNSFTENESNNYMDYANIIYNDYTVSGEVYGTDIDHFQFTITRRSKITITTIAEYRSCFMAGIFNSSDSCLAASLFTNYGSITGDPLYSLNVTLDPGTYYYIIFNEDSTRLTNIYTFYFEYEPLYSTHTHSYSNSCDAICNTCGATRTVVSHYYSNNNDTNCNVCGKNSYPGGNTLVYENGKYYHVINRQKVNDTTLVNYNGQWWYVKNGIVDFKANTLVYYNKQYFHVSGGKWVKDNTLVNYNGKWWYVNNGILNFSYTGKVAYGGKWYNVKNGVKV